jgi:hypothetical protein
MFKINLVSCYLEFTIFNSNSFEFRMVNRELKVFILSIKRNIRENRICAFHALCIVSLVVVHLDLNLNSKFKSI